MEFFKSIIDTLRDRLASPLTGSFLVAWCVTNWRVFVALGAGDATPVDRLALVKAELDVAGWQGLLWLPALVAGLYVVLYGFVTAAVVWLTTLQRKLGTRARARAWKGALADPAALEEATLRVRELEQDVRTQREALNRAEQGRQDTARKHQRVLEEAKQNAHANALARDEAVQLAAERAASIEPLNEEIVRLRSREALVLKWLQSADAHVRARNGMQILLNPASQVDDEGLDAAMQELVELVTLGRVADERLAALARGVDVILESHAGVQHAETAQLVTKLRKLVAAYRPDE